MGKYIKKSKITGDGSVKDITHQTTFDCRTRAAKNLALLRLRSHSHEAESFHYLQLRSRRLVKLPLTPGSRKQQKQQQQLQQQLIHGVGECRMRNPRAKSGPAKKSEAETMFRVTEIEEDCGDNEETSTSDCNFGEKGFNFESGDRETTQCSNLIRDSKAIERIVPSSREIEDFFAYAEQQQRRFFTEKYNFDIVSENPLPGRYEWVEVVP